MALAAISEIIFMVPPGKSWLTRKQHLFNAHIPKKWFKSIRKNAMGDKKDEFERERLRRGVAKIPISATSNGLAETNFCRLWIRGRLSPITRYLSAYRKITFIGAKKEGTNS